MPELIFGPARPLIETMRNGAQVHAGGRVRIAVAWARDGAVISLVDAISNRIRDLQTLRPVHQLRSLSDCTVAAAADANWSAVSRTSSGLHSRPMRLASLRASLPVHSYLSPRTSAAGSAGMASGCPRSQIFRNNWLNSLLEMLVSRAACFSIRRSRSLTNSRTGHSGR